MVDYDIIEQMIQDSKNWFKENYCHAHYDGCWKTCNLNCIIKTADNPYVVILNHYMLHKHLHISEENIQETIQKEKQQELKEQAKKYTKQIQQDTAQKKLEIIEALARYNYLREQETSSKELLEILGETV